MILRLSISVIVCTRDRPADCGRALASLLATTPAECELIVVDQSADDETRKVLEALPGAARITYLQTAGIRPGLSAARNLGAEAARGDLLLYTDDDCEAQAGWVEHWRQAFESDASLGIGFGRVTCPPFDPSAGYTPDFNTREGRHGLELFRLGIGQVGMGANMVLPRNLWAACGGFDELLGAGTRFHSAEDADLAYRLVKRGFRIRHLEAATIVHHGYRAGSSASQLVRGYVVGISAMYMKHVRCGDLYALRLLTIDLIDHLLRVAGRLLRRSRPLGLVALVYYLRGLGSSWRCRVDTARGLYRITDDGIQPPPSGPVEPPSPLGGRREINAT